MTRRPRMMPDPDLIGVSRPAAQGEDFAVSTWRRGPNGVRLEQEFTCQPGALAGEMADRRLSHLVMVLPAGTVICRPTDLPEASDEQLAVALRLHAESFQLGMVPPHRSAQGTSMLTTTELAPGAARVLANVQNVVMDKTGTMTEGVFKVQEANIKDGFNKDEIMQMVNALESKSTHPVATAIHNYVGEINHSIALENVEEIAGHGLKATINGKELLVGNFKLLDKENIQYDIDPSTIVYTLIAIAYDRKFAGYLTIADSIKADAQTTIDKLKTLGVNTTMLSGDKSTVVNDVASKLGIQSAFGDLLPEDKVNKVKEIKAKNETVAFVGDGVNDAPVVALSDVGIAMGGLGSDATIETADVVIQDDMPSKIPMAINIGKQTRKIVWQNITLAFVVKAVVLVLGAGGLATMWEAVFADVGVALLAILNAVRIQKMKF